ncbi:MAG: hypothetical protein WAQ05_26420 [Rubrivivax sp.]
MTTARYIKTDAGREAIRTRDAALSRPARNLLLIIDDGKTGDEWVSLVANAVPADLAQLLQAGYIAERAVVPRASVAAAPVLDPGTRAAVLEAALQALSYRELYDRLTAEARARLGLIKGYRTVLEIEKCSGADEIRKLALRFVDDVRAAQGDDAAREFCRSLGADV